MNENTTTRPLDEIEDDGSLACLGLDTDRERKVFSCPAARQIDLVGKTFWIVDYFANCPVGDKAVDRQIETDKHHGQANCFFEAFQKDEAENQNKHRSDQDTVRKSSRPSWIFDNMGGGVCRRKCNGDDEVGSGKAEQY